MTVTIVLHTNGPDPKEAALAPREELTFQLAAGVTHASVSVDGGILATSTFALDATNPSVTQYILSDTQEGTYDYMATATSGKAKASREVMNGTIKVSTKGMVK
jgi:hypothetical protein